MPNLEVDSIFLEFGERRILTDIHLLCQTEKVCGLIGRNGAGKSCLMQIIFGSRTARYKSVRFDGRPETQAFKKPQLIRYLPQFRFLPPHIRVSAALLLFGLDVEALIGDFPEFSGRETLKTGHLSSGQVRLLESWLIVKSATQFVLLDEPFSYLMPIHVEKLKEIIHREKEKKGFLISDHQYRSVLEICDANYLLVEGKTHVVHNLEQLDALGYIHLFDR